MSLVYRLKECEEQDSEEPEKNWAVYHAMCYEPIAPRKSSETNTWVKAQPKNDPTVKKEEIIAQIGRPSPELIRKTTPMLVRKDIAQKSKLSSKKSALIKNMIKKREQISVVKKKVVSSTLLDTNILVQKHTSKIAFTFGRSTQSIVRFRSDLCKLLTYAGIGKVHLG